MNHTIVADICGWTKRMEVSEEILRRGRIEIIITPPITFAIRKEDIKEDIIGDTGLLIKTIYLYRTGEFYFEYKKREINHER